MVLKDETGAIIKREDRAASIQQVLEKNMNQLAMALPSHIKPERMIRVVTTTLRKNPALLTCSPESLFGCIYQSAQLGLEVDSGLGEAYIVPYRNKKTGTVEATFIPGYRGLMTLARRSGKVTNLYAHCVYEGDLFEYKLGLRPDLVHEPAFDSEQDPKKVTHVYAVALLKEGEPQFDVMTRKQVEGIRARSRAGRAGPWVTDWEAMAKKSVLKRVLKYLPASIEDQTLSRAVIMDDQVDAGLRPDLGLDLGVLELPEPSPQAPAQPGAVTEDGPPAEDEAPPPHDEPAEAPKKAPPKPRRKAAKKKTVKKPEPREDGPVAPRAKPQHVERVEVTHEEDAHEEAPVSLPGMERVGYDPEFPGDFDETDLGG